jgi:hypothetical protein
MDAGAAVLLSVLILLLFAAIGGVVYLIYDRTSLKRDIKVARRDLQDAKRSLAEYRAAAAASSSPHLGLRYDTTDPVMKKLFGATQDLIDVFQEEGCAEMLSGMKESVKEVRKTFKDNKVPCKDISAALKTAKTENASSIKSLPKDAVKQLDRIVEIIMEALCDGSGNVDADAVVSFLDGLASSLCSKPAREHEGFFQPLLQ